MTEFMALIRQALPAGLPPQRLPTCLRGWASERSQEQDLREAPLPDDSQHCNAACEQPYSFFRADFPYFYYRMTYRMSPRLCFPNEPAGSHEGLSEQTPRLHAGCPRKIFKWGFFTDIRLVTTFVFVPQLCPQHSLLTAITVVLMRFCVLLQYSLLLVSPLLLDFLQNCV